MSRWLARVALIAAAVALGSCEKVDDDFACKENADCLTTEVCVDLGELNDAGEREMGVCKRRSGQPCTRPTQCYLEPCYQGFCGGHTPNK